MHIVAVTARGLSVAESNLILVGSGLIVSGF